MVLLTLTATDELAKRGMPRANAPLIAAHADRDHVWDTWPEHTN